MKQKRSFLTTTDLTVAEITRLFRLTQQIKKYPISQRLRQKSLGMIFQQSSTRTRISFEVGMTQLGGHALYLNQNDLKLATGETIGDTSHVLSGYVDGIVARIFNHEDLIELDRYSQVPVINAMTNDYHPCQAFADIFTILEKKVRLKGLTVAFVGDGDNNVTNSLLILCAQLGVNFSLASPQKYSVTTSILSQAKAFAKKSGSYIRIGTDPRVAVTNADVVATDIWTSPDKPDMQDRLRTFPPYQLNKKLLSFAKKDAMVLHCLPAHRGMEITDEVIDGAQSAVWDEAENRLHVQKALLLYLLGRK
ncbi:MAG: ornithine carbamoyltransferase [Parcubacteria group bacterium]|nr:ornithine carbamoyltransferase [Parcubacteria group bacterium]